MRFLRLYLTAYGAFRDRAVNFPARTGGDLHLIFGPNEAGKSTTLRAVTNLLFDFPTSTDDAYSLAGYSALRVGATLQLTDGTCASFMRRKANKNKLFAIDPTTGTERTDQPLPDNAMANALAGLDRALYKSLFGLDLDGLVAGSAALLSGEGELGRSLFQAASGLLDLRGLSRTLEERAGALFKPRATTLPLNRTLKEFEDQKRTLRAATVRHSAWESVERAHHQAVASHADLQALLGDRRSELQRLARVAQNLPQIAELQNQQAALAALADTPLLAADAGTRRAAAQERLRGGEETLAAAQSRLAKCTQDLQALEVRDAVLVQAAEIELAYHAVAPVRAARAALPRVQAQRGEVLSQGQALLAEMGMTENLSEIAPLLPTQVLIARVQTLIDEHTQRQAAQAQLLTRLRPLEREQEHCLRDLAALPPALPANELEQALLGVNTLPDLDLRQRALESEIAELDQRLQRDMAAIWGGSREELLQLRLPLIETLNLFAAELATLASQEADLDKEFKNLTRDLTDRHRDLAALRVAGVVVTPHDIVRARLDRDTRWQPLRAVFSDSPVPPLPALPQVELFESSLREADRLADELHADTERATRWETTRQRIMEMEAAQQQLTQQQVLCAARRGDWQTRWHEVAAPVRQTQLLPAALREWMNQQQRLVERVGDWKRLGREQLSVRAEIDQAQRVLTSIFQRCGINPDFTNTPTLALQRARDAVAAVRHTELCRERYGDQLRKRALEIAELQDARQAVTLAQQALAPQWHAVTASLRLEPDAMPAEARTRLAQFARLAEHLNALRQLDHEAAAHNACGAAFIAQMEALRLAVGAGDNPPAADLLAEALYAALGEAREAQALRRTLKTSLDHETKISLEASISTAQARAHLAELLRDAGCESLARLPQIEAHAAEKWQLQQRIPLIESQLVQQNAEPLTAIFAAAAGRTLEDIERRRADLAQQIEALEQQRVQSQDEIFKTRAELDRMDGSSAAADAEQALAGLAANIDQNARAYAAARIAGAVLQKVIKRYEQEHQGPLLQRAAEVFARITLGSFASLTVDYAQERQVLLGVRADGDRVPVAGMSQGTRDQLFLSLRLAAIEQHIASRGPFPVIVDDLLVQFDDARALATLEVLAELGTKTQVLFFTHHQHLVELAAAQLSTASLAVCTL